MALAPAWRCSCIWRFIRAHEGEKVHSERQRFTAEYSELWENSFSGSQSPSHLKPRQIHSEHYYTVQYCCNAAESELALEHTLHTNSGDNLYMWGTCNCNLVVCVVLTLESAKKVNLGPHELKRALFSRPRHCHWHQELARATVTKPWRRPSHG